MHIKELLPVSLSEILKQSNHYDYILLWIIGKNNIQNGLIQFQENKYNLIGVRCRAWSYGV